MLITLLFTTSVLSQGRIPSERVYLKTDQPFYSSGELFTYHAFVVPSQANNVTSAYIYVDFVDSNGNVSIHQKIKAKDRIGKGEILLPANLETGDYRLFAYTKSMFEDIENLANVATIGIYNAESLLEPGEFQTVPFQIFTRAEGGKLLTGRSTKVYYEVIGEFPAKLEIIELIDINGEVVFKIDKKHTSGIIELNPSAGQSYRFNINHSGNLFPGVSDSGVIVRVDEKSESFEVSVITGLLSTGPLRIVVHQSGQTYLEKDLEIDENSNEVFQLFKPELPDGLITITIFNKDRILSARTVFNAFQNNQLAVNINIQKQAFLKRENVDVSIGVSHNGKKIKSTTFLIVKKEESRNGKNENSELLSLYLPDVQYNIVDKFQSVNDYLIGLEPQTFTKNISTFSPEIEQILSCNIDPASPGFSEELSFVSGYFITDYHTSETRFANEQLKFKIPDFGNSNDIWFYGFSSMGERIGEIFVSRRNEIPKRKYPGIASFPEMNNEVITYLNKIKQRNTISKVYGNPKLVGEVNESKDEVNIVVSPAEYMEFEGMKDFVISVIPKASVKKKNGMENIVLMPSHSYNKFKESPVYFIDGYPTFNGTLALSLDLQSIDYIEIINSLDKMAPFGLLGRNGVFKITSNDPDQSMADTLLSRSYKQTGLDYSYNTMDNQVIRDRGNVNFPDFRTLLYTSLPNKSDVGGTSVFSFQTSDITGKFRLSVYGITNDGILFTKSSSFEVSVPVK